MRRLTTWTPTDAASVTLPPSQHQHPPPGEYRINLKPDEEITFFYEKRKEKKKTLLSEKGYMLRG